MAPYNLVDVDRRFRGAYCLHHQGDIIVSYPDIALMIEKYAPLNGLLLPDYTAQYTIILSTSYPPPREPEISITYSSSSFSFPLSSAFMFYPSLYFSRFSYFQLFIFVFLSAFSSFPNCDTFICLSEKTPSCNWSCSYLTTQQTSLCLVSLGSAVLGELATQRQCHKLTGCFHTEFKCSKSFIVCMPRLGLIFIKTL
jgi:hypothetical protein